MEINTIVAEILRIPVTEISDSTSMESNPLWDSLSHMEIIYILEKKFDLVFNGDEIIEITSVSKIKKVISQKMGECLEA